MEHYGSGLHHAGTLNRKKLLYTECSCGWKSAQATSITKVCNQETAHVKSVGLKQVRRMKDGRRVTAYGKPFKKSYTRSYHTRFASEYGNGYAHFVNQQDVYVLYHSPNETLLPAEAAQLEESMNYFLKETLATRVNGERPKQVMKAWKSPMWKLPFWNEFPELF